MFGNLDKFYGTMSISSAISSNSNYNISYLFGKWNSNGFKLRIDTNLYFYTIRIIN